MSKVHRRFRASRNDVWAVLADPWLYASWVVGASRIRDVTGSWPDPDALMHHSVGAWPVLLDDNTSVTGSTPGRELRLRARGRPLGEAEVVLTLEGEGAECTVTMVEWVVSGPGSKLPKQVVDPLITWRNTESLRRLALIAEGRHARSQPGGASR